MYVTETGLIRLNQPVLCIVGKQHVASVGFMGRLEGTVLFGTAGLTLEGKIRMDFKERGSKCVEWLDLAQD
jgi:hypothetical protein